MKALHLSKKYIEKSIRNGTRDNARTPMQWNNEKYAGFSTTTPWIQVNSNKDVINVKKQSLDKNSILSFYRKLISVRKQYSNIVKNGVYNDLALKDKNIFAYERVLDNEILLVISSFSNKALICKVMKKYENYKKNILLNNYSTFENYYLKPYQSVLLYIKKN